MSNRQTLKDSHSAISSQELEDGQEPCRLRGGVQTDLFGQEALPANHLAQQEPEKARMTSDISGQSSLISSESANLQRSLENRLRQLSDSGGSTIYKLTLRKKDTPQGRSYFHLAASAPRTKGTDSSSWLTPTTSDMNGVRELDGKRSGGLNTQAQAAWPTPSQRDFKGGYQGGRIRNGKISVDTLDVAAQLTPWATPNTMDHMALRSDEALLRQATVARKGRTFPANLREQVDPRSQEIYASGTIPPPSTAETESTAPSQLNPRFSLWLMGYPIEWAYSGERVTPLSRKRRQKS